MPFWRVSLRPLGAGISWLTVLLVVASTISLSAGPARAVPSYTLEERALAIASPSLVYLETTYTGYVRDKQTGEPFLASPITSHRRCSGFVVNPEGYLVTTRVCVQPADETIRQQVLYVAGRILIAERKLDRAQLDAWVAERLPVSVFTGITPTAKSEARLFAQLNIATGALTDSPAIPATVVRVNAASEGNVALVKVGEGNLPAAELGSPDALPQGARLLTLGFNTTDTDHRVAKYTLESKPVQVIGDGKRGSAPYYKINERLGIYSHGGMAIDTTGRVVGMVDEDPTLPNNTNRAVFQLSSITALLADASVSNTLGEHDRLYRSGLDAYFNGRYTNAISQLDKVAANVPTNQNAPIYRQHAIDRRSIEGDSSTRPGWVLPLVAAGGGALLVALAAVGLLFARRARRRRRALAEPAVAMAYAYAPISGPPISGAPISGAPISGSPISGPPISGPPISGPPISGPPISGPPVSSSPVSPGPVSGGPMPAGPMPAAPTTGAPTPMTGAPAPVSPGVGAPEWGFDSSMPYPSTWSPQTGPQYPVPYLPGRQPDGPQQHADGTESPAWPNDAAWPADAAWPGDAAEAAEAPQPPAADGPANDGEPEPRPASPWSPPPAR